MTWLLGASVLLYALQSAYSSDAAKGGENLLFFYLPFGLLFVLLSMVRWRRELLLRCLAIAVAEAVLFAGVGFVEYARKSLFLNPKVVAANQFDNYFRVNSVFFDPSVYGRFLALVMIAVSTVVLWTANRRIVVAGACVLAWLLAGLVTSFSQSSIAALLLGLAVLGGWRYGLRATLITAAGVLVLALAVLLAAPKSLHFGLKGSSGSTSNATSGRSTLIEGGPETVRQTTAPGLRIGVVRNRVPEGLGNDQPERRLRLAHDPRDDLAPSRASSGWRCTWRFLVSAFAVLFTGAGRSPPRIAIAACFAALVLHTWTYADFLEDPFTWTLLAVGAALARGAGPRRAGGRGGAPRGPGGGAVSPPASSV